MEEVKARGKKMLEGLRLVELQNTGEDEALLKQFYDEMMPSNFPLDDERESYESMLTGLKREDDATWYRYRSTGRCEYLFRWYYLGRWHSAVRL